MISKHPRILFFIGSAVPTAEELNAMRSLGTNVCPRNAQRADDTAPEKCDGVAGKVPKSHSHLPRGEDIIAAYHAALAPTVPPAPPAPVAEVPAAPAAPSVEWPAPVPPAPPASDVSAAA